MRRFLSLLFILFSFAGTAQQLQYLGAPNTTVLSRGPFGFALRDTTFTPAQRGVVVHRPNDNALYVSVSNTVRPYWMKLGSGAGFVADPQQCGEMQGGLVTHDSLLVYSVSPSAFYYINCRRFSSNGGRVTLAAAHATLPRRDKIAFDTLGNVVVFTGVPAADPVAIALDPAVYRDLAEILVNAATTTDANAINELVFDENIGQPQEFNFSLSGDVSASGNSTATSASKTKSIIVNSWGAGSSLVFTAAAEFSVVDLSTFTFFIRLPIALTDAQNISVRFRRGGSVASSAVVMPVNKTLLNQWQAVTVRLSDFTFFDMTIDVVDILFGGSNSNTIYFDYIRFQKGIQQVSTPTPSGNYVSHIYKSGDSVFYNIGGTSHFAYLSGAPLDTLPFSLTTTGTSGPATFDTATGILNIPQYSGGGGSGLTYPNTAKTLLNGYGTWFSASTDSLNEGTNLFFTNTRARAAFSAGVGISITAGGEISSTITQYTDAQARAAMATTQTLTDAATVTFDASLGRSASLTIGGNRTLSITNFGNGEFLSLVIIQDATGARTITLPAGTKVIAGGAGAVTLSTAAAAQDILTFWKINNVIYCNHGKNYN